MDIGAPIRRGTMVPEDEPIHVPEPAQKSVPAPSPKRREREKEPV